MLWLPISTGDRNSTKKTKYLYVMQGIADVELDKAIFAEQFPSKAIFAAQGGL